MFEHFIVCFLTFTLNYLAENAFIAQYSVSVTFQYLSTVSVYRS